MKLTFENLGPIRRAELNLDRSLTVIAGENNTGKTWLANMVLAANQALQLASRDGAKVADNHPLASQILADLGAHGRAQVTQEELWRDWNLRFAEAAVWLQQNAAAVLATAELNELRVELELQKFDQNWWSFFRVGGTYPCSLGWMVALYGAESGLTIGLRLAPTPPKLEVQNDALVVNTLLQGIAIGRHGPATSFPAERLAFSALSHRLAASWSRAENSLLKPQESKDLPLLLAWALSGWFETLDMARQMSRVKFGGLHSELADQIESFLGGQVVVDHLGNANFAVGTETLSLAASSSIVKSLAPLVLWLRYWFPDNLGLAIIDEPEICLHPGLQRKLAQIFGMMVNKGWRLMLSTHSDYIADELSLLVRLGAAGEKGKKIAAELGVPAEALIAPDRVRAYEFGEGELKEAKVDENGFILRVLEDPFERRFDDIQRMMTRLEEPDNS